MDFFFGFNSMYDNYEQRAIDRYEAEGLIVDTAAVTDGKKPIETAIKCTRYDEQRFIVVEAYDTREEAQLGHDKWVKLMTAETLPDELVEIGNGAVVDFGISMGGVKTVFKRKDFIDGKPK
jgi:hypothetical protein